MTDRSNPIRRNSGVSQDPQGKCLSSGSLFPLANDGLNVPHMIISPGRKFIFVHIPKTAGTSMALALESRAMKDDILIGDTPKAVKRRRRLKDVQTNGRLWKHSTLQDVQGLVSDSDLADMLVFTLVRNPWDRMVSYYHWLKTQSFDHPAVKLAKANDFQMFVQHPQTRVSIAAAPYGSYVRRNGAEVPTLFVRVEQFEEDVEHLWEHLGFQLELPWENKSDRDEDYRMYFDVHTRAVVAETCAEDIVRFGYQF